MKCFRVRPSFFLSEITVEEAHELTSIFGKDGEMTAERLS